VTGFLIAALVALPAQRKPGAWPGLWCGGVDQAVDLSFFLSSYTLSMQSSPSNASFIMPSKAALRVSSTVLSAINEARPRMRQKSNVDGAQMPKNCVS